MTKTKLTLLLLAALLVGVCLGFLSYGAILRARIRSFSQIPANLPQHITGKLTQRLHLTPPQQQQVLEVFLRYETRMQETREQAHMLFQNLMEEMSREIDGYLTPEQQAEHQKVRDELEIRHQNVRALLRALPPPPPPKNSRPSEGPTP